MAKKYKLLAPILSSMLLFCSCGASSASDSTSAVYNSAEVKSTDSNYSMGAIAEAEYYDYTAENTVSEENPPEPDTSTSAAVNQEMLVYSCNISIDVLEFDRAVNDFKSRIEQYGGFIENENFSDDGGYSQWYYENTEKWHTYSATVRIPSSNYDAFCNSAADLGDVRSKSANVTNVSQEYYDLQTELEIYEAKEERYINLLATVTEDEYAVAIEKELTELQIQIAKIKTRMNTIDTDVAYSTIYMNINEVKEYRAEPIQTETFFQRLGNTLEETGAGFVEFLEWLLFAIIKIFPYAAFVGIIVTVVIVIRRKRKAAKAQGTEPIQIKNPNEVETEAETEENTPEN